MARKNHPCQEFTAEKEPSAQLLWSRTIGPWAGSVVSPSGIGVQRDKNTTGGFGGPLLFGLPRALSRRAGSPAGDSPQHHLQRDEDRKDSHQPLAHTGGRLLRRRASAKDARAIAAIVPHATSKAASTTLIATPQPQRPL